ncbi:MAG: lipid kinase YegS [Sphingobium sp.]|nr:lipid kinase YegS [Sphingobium sp.]
MTAHMRLILNGKQANDPGAREAVETLRAEGHGVDVRVTWEDGDAARLVEEALGQVDHIVAGGGDGTVNEVFAAAFRAGLPRGCALGILPLGTANDFARSTGITVVDPLAALRLAVTAAPHPIDIGLLDDTPFVNLVSGGFGSQVTAQTDPQLKSRLGPIAYVLTGLSRAKELSTCRGRFRAPDFSWEGSFVAFAIGNGRQAGGGIPLCPEALLDDGLLDLMILPAPASGIEALAALLREGADLMRLGVVTRAPWIEFEGDEEIAINLDGEPQQRARFRAECRPRALPVVLGNDALLVGD